MLERRGKVVGIEIKSTVSKPTSGIGAFQNAFRPGRVLLVGGSGLPWQEFLKLNPVQLF